MWFLAALALAADPVPTTAPPGPVAPPADAPLVSPPKKPSVVLDRVAASVNDEVVTLTEIYEFAGAYIDEQVQARGEGSRHAAEREVLERLIARKLVDQEITGLHLDVSGDELDRAMADIASRNGLDMTSLRREIEKTGMSWDQYRSQLEGDLRQMKFAQAVLRPRINISEDELRDAYNRIGATVPRLAHVQAIFLSIDDPSTKDAVLAKAKSLRDQAIGGADFAALSAQNDQAGFGGQGGDMGTFKAGELMPELDKAVFATAAGGIAEPVVLSQGVFLLKVVGFESGADDFQNVRDQLMEQLFQQRMSEEQERWYQQARSRASIKIFLPEG